VSGFIKLHRGWLDSNAFRDEPFCERLAWLWLIENAAWKDTSRRVGKGHVVEVARGQIHASHNSLASAWGWTAKRVRGYLARLEKCSMLGAITDTNGTLLTICNYAKYQDDGRNQGATEGAIRAQSGRTQEEGKRKEEEKKVIMPCPDGVDPDVWCDWLALRKTKRSTVSDSIVKGIRKKADSIGWTLQMALEEMLLRGWQGFEPAWVEAKATRSAMPAVPI